MSTLMRGVHWGFRAFLALGIGYMTIGIISAYLSAFGSVSDQGQINAQGLQLFPARESIGAPGDAIPAKFRDFCQFLEDPIDGVEGALSIADKPRRSLPRHYNLRGLLILTRHGERSPLTEDQALLDMISCSPFHETDRKAFENYAQLIESNEFRSFLHEDPQLRQGGFTNLPHRSKCLNKQMTAEGALQQHRLGTFLLERYSNSSLFSADDLEIKAMTTDYNRTWQSLTAFVSGFLFPLKPVINSVDVIQCKNSFLCSDSESWCKCPKATEWRRQYEREHMRYYQTESNPSVRQECKIFHSLQVTKAFDDLFDFQDKMLGFYACRRSQLPCTLEGTCVTYELMEKLLHESTLRGEAMWERETDFIARRLQTAEAHSIIGKVVHSLEALRANKKKNMITLLSGHDSTIVPLLRVLRVLPQDPPRYASRVIFELFSDPDDQIHVRLLFNGVDLTEKLPFCSKLTDGLCSAKEFEDFFHKGLWNLSSQYKNIQELCET